MKVCFKLVILFNLLVLTACSTVGAVTQTTEQFTVNNANTVNTVNTVNNANTAPQEESTNITIDVDVILEYRDSFKEKETPTIEEIGVENLSSYLFQQFHTDLCYDIGNCFCHM